MIQQSIAEREGHCAASEQGPLSGSIYPRIPRSVQYRCWRRKAGVLTLGLACVFVWGWVRSLSVEDEFHFRTRYLAVSTNGILYVTYFQDVDSLIQFWWSMDDSSSGLFEAILWSVNWNWRWQGFGYFCSEKGYLVSIPYWSIVLPLTLLSTYLLLSKPRPANPIVRPDPNHA